MAPPFKLNDNARPAAFSAHNKGAGDGPGMGRIRGPEHRFLLWVRHRLRVISFLSVDMAAASSAAVRKHFHYQEGLSDKVGREISSVAASLPDRKEWIAEHNLHMLMLNG